MKGKHAKSMTSRANADAQARITELEEEVERLSAVVNVSEAHVRALGEIERLTARNLELERVESERCRLEAMLTKSRGRVLELEADVGRIRGTLDNAVLTLAGFCPPDRPDTWTWAVQQLGYRTNDVVNRLAERLGVDVKDLPAAIRRRA